MLLSVIYIYMSPFFRNIFRNTVLLASYVGKLSNYYFPQAPCATRTNDVSELHRSHPLNKQLIHVGHKNLNIFVILIFNLKIQGLRPWIECIWVRTGCNHGPF